MEGDGWDDWAPRRSTAVRVDPHSTEVSAVVLDELIPIGADHRGLWVTTTTSVNSPDIEDAQQLERSLAGEDVAQPASVQLFRISPDGDREEFTVDRVVSDVEANDGNLRFKFHSRGPVITQESHSGYSYNYPMSSIDIPIDAVPRAIKVGDFAVVELGDIDWMTEFNEGRPLDVDIDFSGIGGSEWTPRRLEEERIAECVAWVQNQLERLSETRAYTDVRVSIAGEWPATEVVAEFHWDGWSDRLIRHRVRVFDDAGRPALQRYMTVYLEETLATSRPSDHPEVDGAIEVQA